MHLPFLMGFPPHITIHHVSGIYVNEAPTTFPASRYSPGLCQIVEIAGRHGVHGRHILSCVACDDAPNVCIPRLDSQRPIEDCPIRQRRGKTTRHRGCFLPPMRSERRHHAVHRWPMMQDLNVQSCLRCLPLQLLHLCFHDRVLRFESFATRNEVPHDWISLQILGDQHPTLLGLFRELLGPAREKVAHNLGVSGLFQRRHNGVHSSCGLKIRLLVLYLRLLQLIAAIQLLDQMTG
mmetsp:Transcript_30526/g.66981  ORF Transcript_30526/g.66981 Transcript_30526/m.66981 type:complete len:236 (+) Transcript_30526:147-854(+)